MKRSLQEQLSDLRATTEANFREVARQLRSRNLSAREQEKRAFDARLEPRPLTSPTGTFQGNQPEFPGSSPSGMSTLDRLRRDQFMPDYSGEASSVVDPGSGVVMHYGNTDPDQGPVGAQPFLYNEWKRLLRNGDFHDPPPDPTLPIDNTTNPLPGWSVGAPDGSNSIYWVADLTSGSGGKIESRSTSAGVRGELGQVVPVRSSTTRNNSVALVVSGYGPGAPVADLAVQCIDSSHNFTGSPPINVSVFLPTPTVGDVTSVGTLSLDGATQELSVVIDLRLGGTGTVTLTEVQLVESAPITVWADLANPANNPATAKYSGGVWTLDADGVAVSGLRIGTNVQAWDADLDTLAASTVTPGGTWVPTLDYGTTPATGWAITTQLGFYTRLLDRVLFSFVYQGVPTNGGGAGNLTLSGLPVTVKNTAGSSARFAVEFQGYTKANFTQITGNPLIGTTTANFRASGSGQTTAALAVADIPTGGTVIVSGSGHYLI